MRRLLPFVLLALAATPALAEDYSFAVGNNANQRIVTIEVSEDDASWAPFDIASGIASGGSAELVRDQSTNASNCEWRFRATFEGGDTLDSDGVDFCEDDVVISFEFD